MARKRPVFFRRLQRFLALSKIPYRFKIRPWQQVIALGCITLLLIVGAWNPSLAQFQTKGNSPEQQFQHGQELYKAGNFQEAATHLEAAAEDFELAGQLKQQAITLSNLSLSLQKIGRLEDADTSIKTALQRLGFEASEFSSDSIRTLSESDLKILAPALDIYGRLWLLKGAPEQALKIWKQAGLIHQRLNNSAGYLTNQINQSQALQALGLYEQAMQKLGLHDQKEKEDKQKTEGLKQILEKLSLSSLRVIGLKSIGDTLRTVGELTESEKVLKDLVSDVDSSSTISSEEKAAVWLSLGSTMQALGDREQARQSTTTKQAVIPWQCSPFPKVFPKAQQNYKKAETAYIKAGELSQAESEKAGNTLQANETQLTALLNRLTLHNQLVADSKLQFEPQQTKAKALWQEAKNFLEDKDGEDWPTLNRAKVYATINLARQEACLIQDETITDSHWNSIENRLKLAVENAEELEDHRAQSYALGELGGLYEYFNSIDRPIDYRATPWLEQAQNNTTKALVQAQPFDMPDIAYQWQWQLGRLEAQKIHGDETSAMNQKFRDQAIAHYEKAVQTLSAVRGSLRVVDSDVKFSFRDKVEPLYRELVELLLDAADVADKNASVAVEMESQKSSCPQNPSKAARTKEEFLCKAVRNIDLLQVAELENFLGCKLGNTNELIVRQEQQDSHTAIIYPILLKDRLAIILDLPKGPLTFYEESISADTVERSLKTLRYALSVPGEEVIEEASKIYNWLLRPLEDDLKDNSIDTLAFILDGELRNIPIGVLYDEDTAEYFVEKPYGIAIVPSLTLFQAKEESRPLNVLMGGVKIKQIIDSKTFPPIEELHKELIGISANLDSPDFPLIDENFNKENIENSLESGDYSAIHWKTHGVFSSDPDSTFIVAYKEKIHARTLNKLIQVGSQRGQNPLELLVLSACETAQGDSRAILGLAGIAVQTGAQSTVSTLWEAQDEVTTHFMTSFYQELANKGTTKAQAFRKAQLSLLEGEHGGYTAPYHWAPYVLVGNWQ